MGNCVAFQISCDQTLDRACGCLFGDENYYHMLEENLEALEKTMQQLEERRDDLLRRVSVEEDKGLQRFAQVRGWLSRVEDAESKVNDLFKARSTQTESLCLCGYCSKNFISGHDYAKRVWKRLKEVKELLSEGVFEVVAGKIPAPKVDEKHVQITVGLDTMVEGAWNCLVRDEKRTLGLHGMGGVGKTTLLARINNKFVEVENEFDVVMWVVVSRDLQYEGIQDQILQRLRLDKEWEQETEKQKASHIRNILRRKKFVLLLDDIWSEVDLNKIGVPPPTRDNGSKMVFTTRSREVCKYMKADGEMKVDCLSPDQAWELFQMTVGEILLTSHQDIPTLARKIVEKCCGLPLALNVIGRAMACKETVQEWHHAVNVLNSSSHEFPGMEENILPILKFSYDSLKDGKVKSCFAYCSLFPEDYEIEKEKVIEYWICEGFINANRFEDGGTNQGYDIIGLLVRAHLLIDCETRVKMHDVIREMALWIESDFGKQKETICSKSGAHVRLIPKEINWETVVRMSLMRTRIAEISCSPNCPNLSTLLLSYNKFVGFPVGFFQFMPELVVLDLSKNLNLSGMPDEISNLGSLRYLNLSHTPIKLLPDGLKKLKKLIYLNLEFTNKLESIVGIAASLRHLQVLKIYNSRVCVDGRLMEELLLLEHLKILTATIEDAMILESIQGVARLPSCIRALVLRNMSAEVVTLNTVALAGLQIFVIISCKISEIKIDSEIEDRGDILPCTSSRGFKHLYNVSILNLEGPKDLTWLLFAQGLKEVFVEWSSSIEEIINKEKGMSIHKVHPDIAVPFEKLESLVIRYLDELKSFWWNPPPLPNLTLFDVRGCPKLPEASMEFLRHAKATRERLG